MELDCQRMEVAPQDMRPMVYFLRSSSGNIAEGNIAEGKPATYGRKNILVYNTEFHTVSQRSYCDDVQGCACAS